MGYMDSVMSMSLQIFILCKGRGITLSCPFTIKTWHKQELVEKSEVGQFSDLLCSVVRIIHQASFMLTSDNFGRASEFHDPSPQETLKHGT